MVGRRGPGHVGHRGVRHGLLRGSTCLEFSKCRYRSPFGTKLKLYIPTDSYKLYLYLSQLSARCQQGSSQRVSAPDASARRWLPPREPLSLRRCRARAPCRGARCETPPMGTGARLAAL